MQQVFDVFNVPEMMPRAKQGQKLIARPGTAFAVESQALKRVFPGRAGGCLDEDLVSGLEFAVGRVVDLLDHQGDLAALNDVVFAKLALAAAKADAVQKGAIGAGQVAELPALFGGADFRVPPADRGVVQDNFEGFEP